MNEQDMPPIPAVLFPLDYKPCVAQQRVRQRSGAHIHVLTLQRVEAKVSRVYGREYAGVAAALPPSSKFREYVSFTSHFTWLRDRLQLHEYVAMAYLDGCLVYLVPTIADLCLLSGDFLPVFNRPLCVEIRVAPELLALLEEDAPDAVYFEEDDNESDPGSKTIVDSIIEAEELLEARTGAPRSVHVPFVRTANPVPPVCPSLDLQNEQSMARRR